MADEFEPGGLEGVPRQAAEAAAALEALKAPAQEAASAIEDAFGRQRSTRNAPARQQPAFAAAGFFMSKQPLALV